MVGSYLKIAFRRFRGEKLYSFIKVAGLSVALVCVLFIYIFVSDELSYDRHNDDPDRLFRIIQLPMEGSEAGSAATTPFPLHDRLLDDYGHYVESVVRLFNNRAPKVSLNYLEGNRQFNETRFYFADSTFFDIFNVRLIQGDLESALSTPDGLVMTEETARRYFGDENPIGKVVRFEGRFNLTVMAIVEPFPHAAHFQFDLLASFVSLNRFFVGGLPQSWEWNICWTYVRLKHGVSVQEFSDALMDISHEIRDLRSTSPIYFAAQPIVDIRLTTDLAGEIGPTSSRQYITIVMYIAVFILLIASVNFINLSLASAMGRSREVGVRKVVGAERPQLIAQHMVESLMISVIALAVALAAVLVLFPVYNDLAGKTAAITEVLDITFWMFAIALVLLVTVLSGLYPALIMSSWSPLELFRSGSVSHSASHAISNLLIVVQFAIATMLISGTWLMFRQLDYLRSQDMGFDREQVVIVPTALTRMVFFFDSFREQVLQHNQINYLTGLSAIVGTDHHSNGYEVEGYNVGNPQSFAFYFTTYDFPETFNIPLAAGRYFDRDIASDVDEAVVVNEAFVRMVGWESPHDAIGKELRHENERRYIVGVLSDFNFSTLKKEIEPLILELPQNLYTQINFVAIKINGSNTAEAIDWIQDKWREVDPTRPFEYSFLDDNIDLLYRDERQLVNVAGFFSLVSILISCVGLFGLASYATEKRSKSIGIRKVLGASALNIVYLLTKDFLRLVLIANVIAIPTIYILISKWLENFAYRIDIDPIVLVISLVLSLLIASGTVAFQTVRVAMKSPVDSLRYE